MNPFENGRERSSALSGNPTPRGAQKQRTIFKVGVWYLFILGAFASYTNWLPQYRGEIPKDPPLSFDIERASVEELVARGKFIVFGTENPVVGASVSTGKGTCPLCHMFFTDQKAERCPNLIGEQSRSENRIKEDRYKMFMARYAAKGEPHSGIKPHAKTGGQYLIESEYCPNCYVVQGFGIKGSEDTESPMPIINKAPIELTDAEIISVVSFLQAKDYSGDVSKVTAREDWEDYFGRKLSSIRTEETASKPPSAGADPGVAYSNEPPAVMIAKMGCYSCHKIPTVEIARTGLVGPLLIEKTNAPRRLKSPEYQRAVAEGRAHASTPKEYVIESILHPDAFVVPGFHDDMLKDFGKKFTFDALDKLADFLLTLDEDSARREGLNRLPQEKEGSLSNRNGGPT